MHPLWFEFDEHDETPENCDPSQREFLRLVREGAQEWPCRPSDTYVLFFPRGELDEDGNTAEHDEMRLGRVSKVPSGPRRLARRLAALSGSSAYAQYADDPPPCDAPHQTPRTPPFGRTTLLSKHALVVDLSHQRVHFLALGASLEADTVRCSELHICNFALTHERPDVVPRDRTGPVEDLAAFTTDWLGEILRRPVLRYDGHRY